MRSFKILLWSFLLLIFCISALSASSISTQKGEISAQIDIEYWSPYGDLDEYWNPHRIGAGIEFNIEYIPRIDLVFGISEHEFEPSYANSVILVPDLWILAIKGGVKGIVLQTSSENCFLEGGFLWVITSFSSDEIAFPGHSARESEGGVYVGVGVDITVWRSWSLQCTCRGNRVFTQPEQMSWFSVGIGVRKTWSNLNIIRELVP